jgi:hypothetical protein
MTRWTGHGRDLAAARADFGSGDWLDRSTGGNPQARPGAADCTIDWSRLPEEQAVRVLEAVATDHFGTNPDHVCILQVDNTTGADCSRPFSYLDNDGAVSAGRCVFSSYVHGVIASPALRAVVLKHIGATSAGGAYTASVDMALDEVAAAIVDYLDVDALPALATQGAES